MSVRPCQTCKGRGWRLVEVTPGKWVKQTCYGCGGTGKVNTKLI